MVKPFDVAELEARIRVLLRRSANQMNPLVQCGNLLFNTNTRQFFVGEQLLSLTPREHALLHTLVMKVGKTVSKQAIFEALFTVSETVSADAIEIYIHRLRKKLQTSQACIITLRGLGYLLTHDGV
jgi:two-component system response regulator TctD